MIQTGGGGSGCEMTNTTCLAARGGAPALLPACVGESGSKNDPARPRLAIFG